MSPYSLNRESTTPRSRKTRTHDLDHLVATPIRLMRLCLHSLHQTHASMPTPPSSGRVRLCLHPLHQAGCVYAYTPFIRPMRLCLHSLHQAGCVYAYTPFIRQGAAIYYHWRSMVCTGLNWGSSHWFEPNVRSFSIFRSDRLLGVVSYQLNINFPWNTVNCSAAYSLWVMLSLWKAMWWL